jgi:hypothetical protein
MAADGQLLYLVGNGVHLVAAGLLALALPDERRAMAASGLLLTPFALFGPFVQGSYWRPERLGGLELGIEDVLFCFAFGALAWGFAALGRPRLPRLLPLTTRFARRAGAVGMLGLLGFLALWIAGLSAIWSLLVVQAGLAVAMVMREPSLLLPSIKSAVILTLYYLAMLAGMVLFFGEAVAALWTMESWFGFGLFGVPIEEILWATSFAAAWAPMLIWAAGPDRRAA